MVRSVLPWACRHLARVAARYQASLDDLWDEATTALLRAAVYYDASAGAVGPYARTAVHRACWRYVIRRHQSRPVMVPLEDALPLPLMAPSAEDEAIALEAAHRVLVLRQHAALADARGDTDTTTRLRDAATAAATVARAARRRTARA